MSSTVKEKWESLKRDIKGFTKKAKDFICDLGNDIVDGLSSAFQKFKSVAQFIP